jgi:hypothetical protein
MLREILEVWMFVTITTAMNNINFMACAVETLYDLCDAGI